MIFSFCLLVWKFVKELGKAEKGAGFGDAMSNGSCDNLPRLYVSFEVCGTRKGIYFEEKGHVLRSMQAERAFLLHIFLSLPLINKLVEYAGECG